MLVSDETVAPATGAESALARTTPVALPTGGSTVSGGAGSAPPQPNKLDRHATAAPATSQRIKRFDMDTPCVVDRRYAR
jgi:hypothetical protein